ncbi:MAG: hypothetical protein HY397_02280 [Candidatus Doudnabacteria bacterium]|nr:hypothetical protein [Candidatus Doudnabacteria bacterium]
MRYILATFIGLALVGGTAVASSNDALPGQPLYAFKRAKEKIQLTLTISQEGKAELQAERAIERLEELAALKAQVQTDGSQGSRSRIEAEAQAEAETQVRHAIEVLSEVEAKLEARGNVEAAAAIHQNILRIEAQTESEVQAKGNAGAEVEEEGKKENEAKSPPGLELEVEGHTNSFLELEVGK